MRASRSALAAVLLLISGAASAAETITYSYDARGRLIKVAHAGTINDGLVASYTLDKADNRLSVAVAGGGAVTGGGTVIGGGIAASASPCLAIVPLGGVFRSIPCVRSP